MGSQKQQFGEGFKAFNDCSRLLVIKLFITLTGAQAMDGKGFFYGQGIAFRGAFRVLQGRFYLFYGVLFFHRYLQQGSLGYLYH